MDATVWNAYQIVSNRARAVCYAARQQQFRMRTELTVNALVHTTQDQLVSMKRMEVMPLKHLNFSISDDSCRLHVIMNDISVLFVPN